jgi:ABC-2 type transport system permease protein
VNLTYLRIDLVRQVRDVGNLAFIIGPPVVIYLVFGSGAADNDEMVGRGNIQFYVMVSMAVYGASVATTSISGMAAVELLQGWGRQLALTPMAPAAYVATKVVIALTVAAGAVAAVFVAGLVTDAQATSAGVWIGAGLLAWLLSGMFALFGLAVAQTFRSESSVSIASAGLVLLAFLGNLFVPLSGPILDIARITPMYGYSGLAHRPQLEGQIIADDEAGNDPMWALILNVVAWSLIFGLIAVWAVRRGRRRQ